MPHRAKEGKPGGFRHVMFLSAFAVPVRGWDLLTTFGGKWADWQEAGEPYTKVSTTVPSTSLPISFG